MIKAYYDFHIHSCLSPCGDDQMTPNNIVMMSKEVLSLDIIALTDHNSVGNCKAVMELAKKCGLLVIPGMEVCTSEEIHAVCLFEAIEEAEAFGKIIYKNIPAVKNDPQIFGNQILMNSFDQPIGQEEKLLVNACMLPLYDCCKLVKEHGGIIFPAHIDRSSYSILSSLGDFPPDFGFRAYEISKNGNSEELKKKHPAIKNLRILKNSDAHILENINEKENFIMLEELSVKALFKAIE